MALLRRGRGRQGTHNLPPAWLPGRVEVQVAGESFHRKAIETVLISASPGSPLTAVLVPKPDNAHDPRAVAVFVGGEHVGFLPREVAARAQPALVAFGNASGGRLVSCPAEIRQWTDAVYQVVLWLDPGPLGLLPEAFESIPSLAATLSRLLSRLDQPQPLMTGADQQARSQLMAAEKQRTEIDADYDRPPQAWPAIEVTFRRVADRLARADDPLVSAAWLGVFRSVRYQRGRRDEALAAVVEALFWDRGKAEAWSDLIEMASFAPHVPTLLDVFSRIPFEARPVILEDLITISNGHDRLGRLNPEAGKRLRQDLLRLAETQGDAGTVAALTGKAGLDAERAGDLIGAVGLWRRAISAGSTDEKVADRLSTWLVKQHEYREAAQVLGQALAAVPRSADTAERMRRRLARCQRQ
jgi:tetratricopeptide (TPR) repeat protein